ncbi:hypothetical protein GCM10009850_041050 [Nonomuraea monospora]|uniref:Chitin-binding type-4 domain-containing protein n=1 Tax=Nonomuraea monospora TaxID=568818 RepID=A0ABN3CH17_9ACTN
MWSYRVGVVVVALLPGVLVAGAPAGAHGALEDPLSRTAACGSEGPSRTVRSPACRAAVRAGGGVLPRGWDEVRVADVGGRDRRVIPDGKLCSGGLDAFKGLDLPRDDWPATTVRAGARFVFKYRGTIPHRGTFRMFVTRKGYRPGKPLRWADLEREPFLEARDPVFRDGGYRISARLPVRSGRHLIYTIWQNSDTPDTYYSCSDVVFRRGGTSGGAAAVGAPVVAATAGGDASWLVGGATVLAGGAGLTGLLIARRRRTR